MCVSVLVSEQFEMLKELFVVRLSVKSSICDQNSGHVIIILA